jgi:hypothetical protein
VHLQFGTLVRRTSFRPPSSLPTEAISTTRVPEREGPSPAPMR